MIVEVGVEIVVVTANLGTKILDFRGFDSRGVLILMGGIILSIGNLPETMSRRILAGIILVGRSGDYLSRDNLSREIMVAHRGRSPSEARLGPGWIARAEAL